MPIHDFSIIRKELQMPEEQEDILMWFHELPAGIYKEKQEILERLELELAHQTKPQQAIHDLLALLSERGCKLGVITRNNKINTEVTLQAAGLAHFFEPESIKTRESAAPKPDPEAVHQLLDLWNLPKGNVVICGDYKHDINAGVAAGIRTIYFNSRNDEAWKVLAECTVHTWDEIIDHLDDQ